MLQKFGDFLSLDNQKLFWFVLFLSLLPLWVVVYPPMVDIPQHAAQISALQQMWAGNTAFTEVFRINWFTPYLMGYLSVYFLALLFPILIAFKIILSLILIAIPVLSGILFREMGADERWKWLVIPSCFGIAFFWGFLNFLVAIPSGLLLLILTVRYDRNASIKNSFLIALYTDRFQWEKHYGADFEYFIVHADEDMREQLFKEHKDSVFLKTGNGRWWLYERSF